MATPSKTVTAEDDRQLVAAVLAGDPAAERRLYDAHVDRVYRLAYRLAGDPDLAQDFTQETFIRAHRLLHKVEHPDRLRSWLFSIARRVCSERRRASAR